MKILIVSNMYPDKIHPSYGIFVKKFCHQIKKIGIDYDLCVMHKGINKSNKIKNYIFFYIKSFFWALFKHYDLIYIHYASNSSLPILLVKKIKKNIKVFTNVHGSDVIPENYRQKRMQIYTKRILSISSRIIVPSRYFREIVKKKYKINGSKIFVYPSGGVDSKYFNSRADNNKIILLKSKLGINNNFPIFGMVGRITPNKRWQDFVGAINLLNQMEIKANYLIIGSGEKKEESKFKSTSFRIKNLIHIPLVERQKLSQYYKLFDFLVFPSKEESLGLVGLESLACGTPVICANSSAPKYYIENAKNGFIFNVESINSLCCAIKKGIQVTQNKRLYKLFKLESLRSSRKYLDKNIINSLRNLFYVSRENYEKL